MLVTDNFCTDAQTVMNQQIEEMQKFPKILKMEAIKHKISISYSIFMLATAHFCTDDALTFMNLRLIKINWSDQDIQANRSGGSNLSRYWPRSKLIGWVHAHYTQSYAQECWLARKPVSPFYSWCILHTFYLCISHRLCWEAASWGAVVEYRLIKQLIKKLTELIKIFQRTGLKDQTFPGIDQVQVNKAEFMCIILSRMLRSAGLLQSNQFLLFIHGAYCIPSIFVSHTDCVENQQVEEQLLNTNLLNSW